MEQMYTSGIFDIQQMRMWEKQPEFDKTWKDAKEYFEELINSIKMYKLNSVLGTKPTPVSTLGEKRGG